MGSLGKPLRPVKPEGKCSTFPNMRAGSAQTAESEVPNYIKCMGFLAHPGYLPSQNRGGRFEILNHLLGWIRCIPFGFYDALPLNVDRLKAPTHLGSFIFPDLEGYL